jgi:DNA-binding MarR family transcriptional regulator/GNAT superfamily N-acetyltransferase
MTADTVEAVRRFNRFYTRQIGLLHKGYLKSAFSLTEVRVLYELAHRAKSTAVELSKELGVDAGYLSRILLHFEKRGLIGRKPSQDDARQSHLSLSRKGDRAFAPLEAKAHAEIAALLSKLQAAEQNRLIEAMHAIERILGAPVESKTPYLLRPHQPGDMGWIVHRHGALYAQEYGWDQQFEALVAEITAKFIQNFNPKAERCWIAEKDGAIAGSIFLVRKTARVAKLRLLLVEPAARGLGIGGRLVDECIRFAREAGYKTITLWTQKNLLAAAHIYRKAGFCLTHEEPHHSFGHDLVAQTWELTL